MTFHHGGTNICSSFSFVKYFSIFDFWNISQHFKQQIPVRIIMCKVGRPNKIGDNVLLCAAANLDSMYQEDVQIFGRESKWSNMIMCLKKWIEDIYYICM